MIVENKQFIIGKFKLQTNISKIIHEFKVKNELVRPKVEETDSNLRFLTLSGSPLVTKPLKKCFPCG